MSNISKTYVDGLELRIAKLQEQVRVLREALENFGHHTDNKKTCNVCKILAATAQKEMK